MRLLCVLVSDVAAITLQTEQKQVNKDNLLKVDSPRLLTDDHGGVAKESSASYYRFYFLAT